MTALRARPALDGTGPRREGRPMNTAGAKVAAVQGTPGWFDRDATIDKVARLTKQAAGEGAALVAFPEAFVPNYPDWVWRSRPWSDGDWYDRWYDQCVDVPGAACDALGAIAADAAVYLAIPVNE